jgi:Winged helix-turn-helix DNA-binding
MATSVEQVIEDRLQEIDSGLESLQAERDRLTRALNELRAGGSSAGRGRRASQPTGQHGRRRRAKPSRPKQGRRAPRGSNQQAILDHVAGNPGATTPQIAQATGIDRAVVYSAVSRLTAAGRLVKTGRDDGQVAYQMPSEVQA